MRVPGVLIIVLVVVAATFAAASGGDLVYDDLTLIARNPVVLGRLDPAGIFGSKLWGEDFPYWRPLTQLALWVGWHARGAAGIHVLSLLIHLGAVATVFAIVRRLGATTGMAAAAALLFGVHPAQVESVAWCSAINDPLWGLLGLLTVQASLRATDARLPLCAHLFFALALLVKETALVIPILVWATALVRRRAADGVLPAWRAFLPMAGVVVAWLACRMLVFGDLRAGFDRSPVELGLPPARMVSLRVELLGRFLGVLAWPFAPDAFRPVARELAVLDVAFLVPAALVLLAFVWLATAWRRRALLPAAGLAVGLLSLLPGLAAPHALNEYPVSDRYLYVTVAGVCVAAAAELWRWRIGRITVLGLAVAFAVGSALRVPVWASQTVFFDAHVAQHPDNPRLLYAQASPRLERYMRLDDGADLAAAEATFARALNFVAGPRYGGEHARARLEADIRLGLAWCAFAREVKAPRPDFARVAALFGALLDEHETLAEAHIGLGSCLANLGRYEAAERHLLRALEIDPTRTEASHNLELLRQRRR